MKPIFMVALTGAAGLLAAMWLEWNEPDLNAAPVTAESDMAIAASPESLQPSLAPVDESEPLRQVASAQPAGEPELPESAQGNPDYPTFASRFDEIRARRDGLHLDPEALLAAMHQPTAWTVDESQAEGLPLTDEERHDGREFIRFSPLKVETLVPGDVIEIPIWQANANYRMQVDRVEAHGDGNVTWYGHLKEFERDNQVTITRGESLTYGGITTPDALYVLEARGEKGWIADSGTLFKGEEVPVEPGEAVTD